MKLSIRIASLAIALLGVGLPVAEASLKRVPTDGSSKVVTPAQLTLKKGKVTKASRVQDKRARVSPKQSDRAVASKKALAVPEVYDVSASAPTQVEISKLKKEKKKAEKKARKEKAKLDRS